MRDDSTIIERRSESLISTHTVLRNTYLLLGLTLIWSGACAGYAMISGAPPVGILFFIIGAYGLMFLTQYLRNSAWGILSVFLFTGFMGYTLGPMLNAVLHQYVNGASLIMTALGGTGLIFFALSAYVLITRRNFSFLGNFMFAGFVVLLLAMVAGIFLHMPGLQLAISAGFMLFSAAAILYTTSAIIHNGERNYIMATVALYVQIYNLFVSLLSILSALSGRN